MDVICFTEEELGNLESIMYDFHYLNDLLVA